MHHFAAMSAMLLALVGTGRAVAADWATGFESRIGKNVVTSARAVDAGGNVYVTGYFDGETLTLGAVTLTRIGTTDAFVAKLDASGVVLWATNFGGSGAAAAGNGIAVDGAGNVYLSGNFQNGNLTTPALTKIGNQDAFAFKLDAAGATMWAKNFGGSGAIALGTGIAVDGAGNVYLGGNFGDANLTTPALTRIGSYDAFAFKLDAAGATVWAKNFGGSGAQPFGTGIAVDSAGNVYLGGRFGSANLTTPALTKIGNQDAFAFKLDAAGTILWAKNFGGGFALAYGTGIAVDSAGNVYLGGHFLNANLTTPALTRIGNVDVFAFKLDAAGTTLWAKNFGGSGAQASGTGIAVDGAGSVYLGGYFGNANLTTPALTRIGNNDAFAFKLDAAGTTVWAKNYGGSGAFAAGNGIAVDGAGNVHLGGYFQNANLTTPALTRTGNQDAFAFKLDATGTSVWAKSFVALTPGGNSVVAGTTSDAAGNVYVTGHFDGVTLTLGAVTLTRIGAQDAFVAKLEASGAVLWARNFGGGGASVGGTGIAVDGAGNVYLGGYFANANLTTPVLTKIGNQDAFAFKLDAAGTILWAKNFGGSGAYAYGQGIAVDGAGNVYLGGLFNANLTTPALTRIGDQDAFAFKLDAAGVTVWAKNFGGSGAIAQGNGIAVDVAGNVYVGGYFYNANLTTPALTLIGNRDAFAVKLDAAGTTVWAKNFGGSGSLAFSTGIAVDGAGNVYLGGYFQNANLTSPALTRIGNADAFAFKLDAAGATVWAKNFGGSGAIAYGNGIAVDGVGNVYLGGSFDSANLTTPALTRTGNQDAFAFKLDAAGATVWAKNYGGSGAYAFGTGIAAGGADNVYLGGNFQNANLTTPALTKVGNQGSFVLRQVAANVPDAPAIGTATAGNASATVTFTAPVNDGGSAITGYTVTASPAAGGDSNAGSTSTSHVVTGLTNGNSYTFTVTATNAAGTSLSSGASNTATPVGPQTINFTSSAPAAAVVGGTTYNVTATGGASGNPVIFTIDATATSFCSISTATVSFIGVGTCTINANQAGSIGYNAAPQVQQSFAVGKGAQTVVFTSSAPASATVAGPTYTVSATGGASGNPVTFSIDATASSVCSIMGSTVSFTAVGTCVINANQGGNTNYNAAPQAQQSFTVGKGAQSISFTSTAPAAAVVGGTRYSVTATGGASGNAVTFTIDAIASSVCSISGSTVLFTAVGTCVINANQVGNTNYNAAPQAQQSFAVAKGAQSISFTSTAPAAAVIGGTTYSVIATGGASGNTVTFTIDAIASSVCLISGSTVSFTAVGTCMINANQAGSSSYNAAPQAQQSFAVGQGTQTILFTSSAPASATVAGPSYTVSATGGASGNPVTFTIDAMAASVCSIIGSTVSFTAVATCRINANQAGNTNYSAAAQAQQFFTVTPTPPAVSAISPAKGSTAGGTAVTLTGTNFSGVISLTIGGAPATSVVVVNDTTITAVTPAHGGGPASVVAFNGSPSAANALFTYFPTRTDFNNNGRSDILFRNAVSGEFYLWLMNGLTITNAGSIATLDLGWTLAGTGDYNGDGKSDLLFRNAYSGEVYLWLMNGGTIATHGSVAVVADPYWQIVGSGDFDGDGKSDLLWRNSASGELYIWRMNGLSIASSGSPGTVADPSWTIAGTGDFDGDGRADILWRNTASGELYLWLMNGTTLASHGSAGVVSDLNWRPAAVGDFNGDGKTDIVFRHQTSGAVYMWLMNGVAVAASGSVFTVGDLGFQIVGAGDYNGDGKADLLWRHSATGQIIAWLMNGLVISSNGTVNTVSDLNWGVQNLP